jgi:hypothetical protein
MYLAVITQQFRPDVQTMGRLFANKLVVIVCGKVYLLAF